MEAGWRLVLAAHSGATTEGSLPLWVGRSDHQYGRGARGQPMRPRRATPLMSRLPQRPAPWLPIWHTRVLRPLWPAQAGPRRLVRKRLFAKHTFPQLTVMETMARVWSGVPTTTASMFFFFFDTTRKSLCRQRRTTLEDGGRMGGIHIAKRDDIFERPRECRCAARPPIPTPAMLPFTGGGWSAPDTT